MKIMRLELHGIEIKSIFDLLGENENGLTFALGWTLSNNIEFLKAIMKRISNNNYRVNDENSEVRLQRFGEKDRGFTDIEILVNNDFFAIIEAKKGWNLPNKEQLKKYSDRILGQEAYKTKSLIVISECKEAYAKNELEKLKLSIPIVYLSWLEVFSLIKFIYPKSSNFQKQIINNLIVYFKKVIKVITMQDRNSNKVFCVVLGSDKPEWSKISWIEIVEKERKYFYPIGKNWPRDPPNYIAFRYNGKLQSIHHVEKYEVVTKMYEHLPVEKEDWEPFFLLTLGKPFMPSREVKNGNIHPQQHLWFDLDTVFTSRTIKEARDITQKRERKIEPHN